MRLPENVLHKNATNFAGNCNIRCIQESFSGGIVSVSKQKQKEL
jgi:hypothetical protein